MRITTPSPDERTDLVNIDLADTALYTCGDAHLAWQTLRSERPVFWQEVPGNEGFWSVTRHEDVRRVLSEHNYFSSEQGTAISMLGGEDLAARKMMHATNPPRHRQFRSMLGRQMSPDGIRIYLPVIGTFVNRMTEDARASDVWDAAATLNRLPMQVAAVLLGIPPADGEHLLRLVYRSLAPHDPTYSAQSDEFTARIANL
jgi:cytochrome P450